MESRIIESEQPHRTEQIDWDEMIHAWEGSGLSGAAFCKKHGLVLSQFYYRKRRLRDRQAKQSLCFKPVRVVESKPLDSEGLKLRLKVSTFQIEINWEW